jgi:hypothetical protein
MGADAAGLVGGKCTKRAPVRERGREEVPSADGPGHLSQVPIPPPPTPIALFADAPVPEQRVQCAGETITRIDVYRYAPSRRTARTRAQNAADAPADETLRGQRLSSDTDVIRAYLRLKVGRACLEQDRADSERMLRAQRFIASAAVTPISVGPGRVRIRVDVVNEFGLVIGGGLRGLTLDEVRLGTLDYGGKGRTVIGSLRRGGEYRDGVGLTVAQPGFAGLPATLTLAAAQKPLGGGARATLFQPLLADGQRVAFIVNVDTDIEFQPLLRGAPEPVAVRTEHSTYQAGLLRRMGGARGRRAIGLLGVIISGALATTDDNLVEITENGLLPVSDTALLGRYPTYRSNHAAGVIAIRGLRFRTVSRFDALRAEQDVATGAELTLMAGPSLGTQREGRDDFMAFNLYAGRGTGSVFTSLGVRFDGRRRASADSRAWLASVGSLRLARYRLLDANRTRQFTLSASGVQGVGLPMQLSMADVEGGLIGYANSTLAGGRRVTARLEQRRLVSRESFWADIAVGTFLDVGRIWAGDVPYGETGPLVASTGFSLQAAYPSGGKRLYRVDFGVPLRRGPGDASFVVRFSATDRTLNRTPEPRDVTRSRLEAGPASLLRW